jgi:predicted acylesterase/phospholipase RssA
MFKNIVISGGGFKTFGLLGALKYYEKEFDNFKTFQNYLGCSAGSLICLFLCLEYKIDDIIEILKMFYFKIKHKIKIKLENVINFFENFGLIDNIFLDELIEDLLLKKFNKNDINFIEFSKITGKNLIINSSNLTKKNEDYFNVDNNPEMSIKLAIKISMCVPLIFIPIKYNNNLYIDGGLYNNFPINYFNFNKIETLGLTLKYNKKEDITNFTDYCRAMINSVLQKLLESTNNNINNDNIFELSLSKTEELFSFKKLEFLMNEDLIKQYIKEGFDKFQIFIKTIKNKNNLLVDNLENGKF